MSVSHCRVSWLGAGLESVSSVQNMLESWLRQVLLWGVARFFESKFPRGNVLVFSVRRDEQGGAQGNSVSACGWGDWVE